MIELLVVVSIIALLVSILLPALGRARERGQSIVCATNTKTLGFVMHLYAGDNADRLPYLVDDLPVPPTSRANTKWFVTVRPYVNLQMDTNRRTNADFYICPARDREVTIDAGTGSPGNNNYHLAAIDYGVNYGGLHGGLFRYIVSYPTQKGRGSERITDVRMPAEIFMLMDSKPKFNGNSWYSMDYVCAPYTCEEPDGTQYWSLDSDYDGDGIIDSSSKVRDFSGNTRPYNGSDHRHYGGLNVAFVDGHSARIVTAEWTEKMHWVW